jgi:hypothetical protein
MRLALVRIDPAHHADSVVVVVVDTAIDHGIAAATVVVVVDADTLVADATKDIWLGAYC